jgi:cytochrome c
MIRFVAALAVIAAAASTPALAQDGSKTFNMRCKTCHGVDGAGTKMGPSLKGVYGAKMAGRPGFNYSPALKAKGEVWKDAQLDGFLSGPQKFVPGTKMMVSVPSPADRAALIAHLKTLK